MQIERGYKPLRCKLLANWLSARELYVEQLRSRQLRSQYLQGKLQETKESCRTSSRKCNSSKRVS